MVQFNFTYDPNVSLEQRVGFELAAMIWGTYLTDDVTINLHIACSESLGDGTAVGGAIPLLHEQDYGVYQEYATADVTSDADQQAMDSLQDGNTTDFLVDNEIVDGNTDIMLTSAQAKALGMDEAIALDNGTTWERSLVDPNALDGYILISNSFDWNYDYTRSGDAPEGTLDFLSMALHEIGHQLGFVSSLDGTLDINELYSGETQVSNFSVLDLFRLSTDSASIDNPDGAVSDLTIGENSYFSLDGGETNLGAFSTGQNTSLGGDGYQASHWKRLKDAMGIMDPTLAYKERLSLGYLDLQALDVLGWDVDYSAISSELDMAALLLAAEQAVASDLGVDSTWLTENRGGGEHQDLYSMGFSEWWQILEKHVLAMGFSEWWQVFEATHTQWQQQQNGQPLEMGFSEWWQSFEATILDMGFSEWWQTFETDMLSMGFSEWWQLLEMGFSEWWQKLDPFFSTLEKLESSNAPALDDVLQSGTPEAPLFRGGGNDDIIGGTEWQDRVDGMAGDDLIDGRAGDDILSGSQGRDTIYGYDGEDILYGGEDNDLLLGENDNDQLFGEQGADVLVGHNGEDILSGGDGRDELSGGRGADVMLGDKGDDLLSGEDQADLLMGGSGRDILEGGAGNDVLYGDQVLAENQAALVALQQTFLASMDPASIDNQPALEPIDDSGFIRIEAETMNLSSDRYVREASGNASNGYLIRNWSDALGAANTTFMGPAGEYMVVVNYLDESDGQATAAFNVNGTEIDSWIFNQDNNRFANRTVATRLTLNQGDVIELTGLKNAGEEAQFDYIDFISLDNLLTTPAPEDEAISSSVSESLLLNSGFESGLNNWSVHGGNVTASQQDAYIGSSSLRLNSAGANAGQNIDVVGSQTYSLSSYAKSNSNGWTGFGVSFMDENWQQLQVETISVTNTEWQLYEKQIAAPAGARYANIWTYNGGDTGDFLLDDLSLFEGRVSAMNAATTATADDAIHQPSNLLSNGDFSTSLSRWNVHSGSAQVTQSDAYSDYSLQLTDAGSVVGQAVKASAGTMYQVNSAGKFTGDVWSGFGVDFYDVNWQKISSNPFEVDIQNWSTYEHQVVAPEGTFHASVWAMKNGDSGQLLLDNLFLQEIEVSTVSTSVGQIQAGLVAHWSFDEAAGSVVNSVQGFQGTLRNMEAEDWVAGAEGHALGFDGADESIHINDAQPLRLGDDGAEFTIAFWLKPETGPTGEFRTILNKWSNEGKIFGFWLDERTNRLKYSLSTSADQDTGSYSESELALNTWTHVTYVRSGNQLSLYLNGELDSSMTVQGTMQAPEGLLELGGGLRGELDELRFYHRGLNLAEVQSLAQYNADVLRGGPGDDTLYGNDGDDILDGTNARLAGLGELDRLSGGSGRDLFILGDANQAYYGLGGSADYAVILDFDANSDVVQLHGNLGSYTQQQQDNHVELLYQNDLVAIFDNEDSLNLESNSFRFVG